MLENSLWSPSHDQKQHQLYEHLRVEWVSGQQHDFVVDDLVDLYGRSALEHLVARGVLVVLSGKERARLTFRQSGMMPNIIVEKAKKGSCNLDQALAALPLNAKITASKLNKVLAFLVEFEQITLSTENKISSVQTAAVDTTKETAPIELSINPPYACSHSVEVSIAPESTEGCLSIDTEPIALPVLTGARSARETISPPIAMPASSSVAVQKVVAEDTKPKLTVTSIQLNVIDIKQAYGKIVVSSSNVLALTKRSVFHLREGPAVLELLVG